jgi:hypothetical protein
MDFKYLLFEFYNHRHQNQPEIAGSTNNYYMNFDEYLLLFFLDRYKYRNQAEYKILETLISLKYYWDMWPRARMFALLTGFLKPTLMDVNHAKGNPQLAIPNVDIYLQEFFMHAFAILFRNKDDFFDSKDGITYLKYEYEENATQALITWFGEEDNRKWFNRVRKSMKRIKINPTDEQETELIDIDALLEMYVEEFQGRKKKILKDLHKEFMKKFSERKDGVFSTDELDRVVQLCLPLKSNSAFTKFPS